jgi:PAS domain S-box-containing protein
MGDLLTRLSPGTSFLRAALAGALPVLGLLVWLISKASVSEFHFTWIVISSLVIVAVAMLAGIAFLVNRRHGVQKITGRVMQPGQMRLDGPLREEIEEPETEARLQRWAKAAFTVAVMLTVLLSLLSWHSAQQAAETADWVAHTHEVMTVLESALRHSLDVETGGRGFAETGSAQFLQPYESGRPALVQDLHALRLLLVTRDQMQRLNVLEGQTNNQLEGVEAILATRQNLRTIPTLALFEHGKHDMDAVRITVEQMEVAERELLVLRTQRARAAQHSSSVVIALGSLLGVMFLTMAGMTVSREIGVSASARARVKALNTGLERRVEQRTAALRESEERFQTMANGIQQLAWMADADGSIFWYNQRWYDYTGTTLEETKGWTWDKIHDPAFLPKVLDRWKEAIATGTPFFMEFPLRGADGSFHMFLTRVMPVRNSEGRVVRWLGTNTDISERKQTEEQLAQSAVELAQQAEKLAVSRRDLEAQTSMLKLILESMGEGLIAADQEGHFLLWNDAANKLMGRGAIDLPTNQWTPHYKVFLADGITPCASDRLPLVRALSGETVKVELMVQPPEPEPGKFIEVTARPLNDARGNLRGGVAVLHDITERKRSEADLARQAEELHHSRQALETQTFMLQSVLDSMVEGLVAADEHGKFILWNPAAEKIMGLGATNLPSREWSAHYGLFLADTVTPIPPGESPLERTLRGERGTTEIFLRHEGVDRGLWLEAIGSPLIDKNGVMRGGLLAFRDITQRKTDEMEIRKLNEDLEDRIARRTEQLQATNHELEAFSYSISHDLRTPLRHIAGFSRILVNDFGPAMAVEAREHLQSIEDAVSRMGLLIDALLKMAVLRRQSLQLDHSELNPIVDEVISMLQPECQGRNVEWRIAKLPVLDCDPILMAQVFQNLLGNALKYSRGRGNAVIEVDSIQQPDKPPIIFVRDNGAGFNMKYAERLFSVFQRFHTESEFEGTGVGLATVHRIIQKHGGMIWAEAEPDHGATFYFSLQMTEQVGTTPKATAAS